MNLVEAAPRGERIAEPAARRQTVAKAAAGADGIAELGDGRFQNLRRIRVQGLNVEIIPAGQIHGGQNAGLDLVETATGGKAIAEAAQVIERAAKASTVACGIAEARNRRF